MKLVSPQDQAELIYLKKLINSQSDNTFRVSSSTWIISESSSNSVDYNINWDSSIGAEKCIGRKILGMKSPDEFVTKEINY